MNKIDLINMSLKNLFKRKVRTFLTILSVVIGATSIIVMVSLGVALDEKFKSEIQSLDTMTIIEINAYNNKVTSSELKSIKEINSIVTVSPILESDIRLILDGRYVGSFDVIGIDPYSMKYLGYEVEQGRLLNEEDEGKLNIVFGDKTLYAFSKKGKAERWYKYVDSPEEIKKAYKADVLNGTLKITTNDYFGGKKNNSYENYSSKKHKTFKANAVGILKESDNYSKKHKIFLPYTSLEKIIKEKQKINQVKTDTSSNGKKGYEKVMIKVDSFENVEKALEDIKEIFKAAKKDVSIYSEAEFVKSSKRLTSMVQALLGGIGGISLFIAAIGITNTMIMSVYERTKEIGVLKVIGAKVSDIKKLFLLEASLIGFIGGFIGVLISYLISFSLNKFGSLFLNNILNSMGESSKISSIPLWLAVGSLIFSSFIGLLAGYLPAKKVVKIEALKAIKSE